MVRSGRLTEAGTMLRIRKRTLGVTGSRLELGVSITIAWTNRGRDSGPSPSLNSDNMALNFCFNINFRVVSDCESAIMGEGQVSVYERRLR
jgi:hypothetical protein